MGEGSVPAVYGGPDFRRLLRDVEDQYSGAFDELGLGTIQDFKHMIDCIDAFLDLLADSKTDFWAKLTRYGKTMESSSSAVSTRDGWAIR